MPKKYTRITKKTWTEEDIQNALAQVARGASYRSVATKYGVSDSMLRKRQKMIDENREKEGSGKNTILSKDEENQLASYIGSQSMQIGI